MTDPRFDTVVETALGRIQSAVSNAIDKVTSQLGPLALSASSNVQRQVLMSAERDMQAKSIQLQSVFARQFKTQTEKSTRTTQSGHQAFSDTDWTALSLVDNAEVERGVTADRLAQVLSTECDGELEALYAYMAALQPDANPEHNPLRPQTVAKVLLSAMSELACSDDVIQVISPHLGRVLGPELATCYGQIVSDMRARGIKPQGLSVTRSRSGTSQHGGMPATSPGSLNGDFNQATQPGGFTDSADGRFNGHAPSGHAHSGHGYASSTHSGPITAEAHMRAAQALSEMFGVSMPGAPLDGPAPMGLRAPRTAGGLPAANPDFQNLLRQIASQAPAQNWTADFPGSSA